MNTYSGNFRLARKSQEIKKGKLKNLVSYTPIRFPDSLSIIQKNHQDIGAWKRKKYPSWLQFTLAYSLIREFIRFLYSRIYCTIMNEACIYFTYNVVVFVKCFQILKSCFYFFYFNVCFKKKSNVLIQSN